MKCDSTVLGSLTKAVISTKLWIQLEPQYRELTFDRLAQDRKMEILTDSTNCEIDWGTCDNKTKEDLEELLKEIETRLCGLDLDIMDGIKLD